MSTMDDTKHRTIKGTALTTEFSSTKKFISVMTAKPSPGESNYPSGIFFSFLFNLCLSIDMCM